MIDQKVIETAANTAENEKPGSTHALVGKIARLPKHIRDQLNRRLEENHPTEGILPWLNALPEVQKILAAQFDGAPISHRNLSNWRLGGFQRWLQNQGPLAQLKQLGEDASDILGNRAAFARGAAAILSSKFFELIKNTPPEKLNPADLSKAAFAITSLLSAEQNAVRLQNEKTRIQQRDEQLILMRDKHQRDVIAIGLRLLNDEHAKLIANSPISYEQKNELLGTYTFGDLWEPRPVATPSQSDSTTPAQL
jgi:hypothetical protein